MIGNKAAELKNRYEEGPGPALTRSGGGITQRLPSVTIRVEGSCMRRVAGRPGRPGRRARRLVLGAVAVSALLLSTGIVWRAAYASFTVSTPSFVTTWSTGTVSITDDDAGKTMFSLSGLAPGAAATRCITVTSTGNVSAVVRLYGANRTTKNSLASYVTLTVLAGSGGTSTDCSGFVADSTVYRGALSAFPSTYGTGVGAWTTSGNAAGETRSYQFTYLLNTNTPSTAQSGTAGLAFTWEAQPA